jgi:hypothetical protein
MRPFMTAPTTAEDLPGRYVTGAMSTTNRFSTKRGH